MEELPLVLRIRSSHKRTNLHYCRCLRRPKNLLASMPLLKQGRSDDMYQYLSQLCSCVVTMKSYCQLLRRTRHVEWEPLRWVRGRKELRFFVVGHGVNGTGLRTWSPLLPQIRDRVEFALFGSTAGLLVAGPTWEA